MWRMGGVLYATLVVKATFAFAHERDAWLVAPSELVRADQSRENNPASSLAAASETAPYLPRAEVLVSGHAFALGGKPIPATAVRLAIFRSQPVLDKTIHVFGDRLPAAPANPRPFTTMPLVYERAYGGPGVPENPVGVGLPGSRALPNLIYPANPAWPAGFGPVAPTWVGRDRLRMGAPPERLSAAVAEIPAGFDWRYFHSAPSDQQLDYLTGDEWIVLDGMHPTLPRVQSRLPSVRARARFQVSGPGGAGPRLPLELYADMLVIDADRLVGSVVWRGCIPLPPLEAGVSVRFFAGLEVPGRPVIWPEPEPISVREKAPASQEKPWSLPPNIAAIAGMALDRDVTVPPTAIRTSQKVLPFAQSSGSAQSSSFAQPSSAGDPELGSETLSMSKVSQKSALPFVRSDRADEGAGREGPRSDVGGGLPFVRSDRADEGATRDGPRSDVGGGLPFVRPADVSRAPQSSRTTPDDATPPARPSVPPPPLFSKDTDTAPPARPSVPPPPPFVRRGEVTPLEDVPLPAVPPSRTAPPQDEAPPPPSFKESVPASGAASIEEIEPENPMPRAAFPAQRLGLSAQLASPSAEVPQSDAPSPPSQGGAAPQAAEVSEPSDEPANRLRDLVQKRLRAGEPLNDLALTGADLHDIDFSGVVLPQCNMTGARLVRCKFVGARLTEGQFRGADLTDADLSGADLSRADLTRATVAGARFEEARLSDANLTQARGTGARFARATGARVSFARGVWDGAVFDAAELSSADFNSASLDGATFKQASLAEVSLENVTGAAVVFDGAQMPDARARGATLTKSSLQGAALPRSVWDGSTLTGSSFADAVLERASLLRASCVGASFAAILGTGANLQRVSGDGASFAAARLEGADLRQARLPNANLEGAVLTKAVLTKADLGGARLVSSNLTDAMARGAKLKGADLSNASLEGADLRDADLLDANLQGASRRTAKLGGAAVPRVNEGEPGSSGEPNT